MTWPRSFSLLPGIQYLKKSGPPCRVGTARPRPPHPPAEERQWVRVVQGGDLTSAGHDRWCRGSGGRLATWLPPARISPAQTLEPTSSASSMTNTIGEPVTKPARPATTIAVQVRGIKLVLCTDRHLFLCFRLECLRIDPEAHDCQCSQRRPRLRLASQRQGRRLLARTLPGMAHRQRPAEGPGSQIALSTWRIDVKSALFALFMLASFPIGAEDKNLAPDKTCI